MNMVFGIGLIVILAIFIFYPILQFIDHMLFTHNMENRVAEYRLFAAKLAATEYLMIQIINAERKALGFPEIPQTAIIDQFRGVGAWSNIKERCKSIVRDSVKAVRG